MAKKKSKEMQNDIMESAHKVWLAGLGAVAMAEQEGSKFFTNLMEQGQKLEGKSKKQVEKAKGTVSGMKTVAESYWETFGRTVDDQMTAVIHRIGVPTKDEIETLTKKVEDLTSFGLGDITRVKHVTGVTDDNRRYLTAKLDWGHELDPEDLGAE